VLEGVLKVDCNESREHFLCELLTAIMHPRGAVGLYHGSTIPPPLTTRPPPHNSPYVHQVGRRRRASRTLVRTMALATRSKSSKVKFVHLCEDCGEDFPQWHGKCPNCGEWNT
jgi:hypothetical protein